MNVRFQRFIHTVVLKKSQKVPKQKWNHFLVIGTYIWPIHCNLIWPTPSTPTVKLGTKGYWELIGIFKSWVHVNSFHIMWSVANIANCKIYIIINIFLYFSKNIFTWFFLIFTNIWRVNWNFDSMHIILLRMM